MIPHSEENGTLVFLKSSCDLYGMPDLYGYTNYIVIDNVQEYVTDYKMGEDRKLRPIHRYNRKDRFVFILCQLLGLRGFVPDEIVEECRGCRSWEEIRKVLKSLKKSKYYNRIPFIMKRLGLPQPVSLDITNDMFRMIVDDFLTIQFKIDTMNTGRKYFPSLRYIAIKLIESYGGECNVEFIRTKRKFVSLNTLWAKISI